MITVTLYTRAQCAECDQALTDLQSLQETVPHQLVQINVDQNQEQTKKIGGRLPVMEIGPYHLYPPFTRQDMQIMLSAARDRVGQLERVDQEKYQKRLDKGHNLSGSDRLTDFLSNHYLVLVNVLIFIYVGLPFLAPVLLDTGHTLSAGLIYKVYGAMCHQLAFRSFFLFGEQPYYPRELAGVPNVITYETLQNTKTIDIFSSREFTGNPVAGYKVALCERDVAIYLFMLLFGLVFAVSGRRFRSIPWYIWVIFGLVPIGLDGTSQLPSLITNLPNFLPLRESTPLLRTLTGGLFGWMTAWYLFPMLEQTSQEARLIIHRKMAVIEQTGSASRP